MSWLHLDVGGMLLGVLDHVLSVSGHAAAVGWEKSPAMVVTIALLSLVYMARGGGRVEAA
jgi:hypothetical protein